MNEMRLEVEQIVKVMVFRKEVFDEQSIANQANHAYQEGDDKVPTESLLLGIKWVFENQVQVI